MCYLDSISNQTKLRQKRKQQHGIISMQQGLFYFNLDKSHCHTYGLVVAHEPAAMYAAKW